MKWSVRQILPRDKQLLAALEASRAECAQLQERVLMGLNGCSSPKTNVQNFARN